MRYHMKEFTGVFCGKSRAWFEISLL